MAFKLTEWIVQMIWPQHDFDCAFPLPAPLFLLTAPRPPPRTASPICRKFSLLSMSVKKSAESRVARGRRVKGRERQIILNIVEYQSTEFPYPTTHAPCHAPSMTNLPGSFLVVVFVFFFYCLLFCFFFYCRCCCFCCCCCSLVALGA